MPPAWAIRPQTHTDPVTGLTLEFAMLPIGPVLRLSGKCLPHGNRQIEFDPDGQRTGSGTWITPGAVCSEEADIVLSSGPSS